MIVILVEHARVRFGNSELFAVLAKVKDQLRQRFVEKRLAPVDPQIKDAGDLPPQVYGCLPQGFMEWPAVFPASVMLASGRKKEPVPQAYLCLGLMRYGFSMLTIASCL